MWVLVLFQKPPPTYPTDLSGKPSRFNDDRFRCRGSHIAISLTPTSELDRIVCDYGAPMFSNSDPPESRPIDTDTPTEAVCEILENTNETTGENVEPHIDLTEASTITNHTFSDPTSHPSTITGLTERMSVSTDTGPTLIQLTLYHRVLRLIQLTRCHQVLTLIQLHLYHHPPILI